MNQVAMQPASAPVDTDPGTDFALKEKTCQDIKENESKQLLADQQIALDQKETSEQAQITGGYGVITLFDGVSSVVPALTKKFGNAPAVAILAENDIDVRAVVCSQCVQIMFKAKYIYKNYAFSIFDHTTMRKKTHQNELDGWKHDGWALASG